MRTPLTLSRTIAVGTPPAVIPSTFDFSNA
jgi:hypothetical protein